MSKNIVLARCHGVKKALDAAKLTERRRLMYLYINSGREGILPNIRLHPNHRL
ncbi:MAG: hypothetical protein RSH79_02765 [Clostridiales bacterium]